MVGEIISGLLTGISQAAVLWMQGKEDEARAAMDAAIDEALTKKAAHEKRHAERDEDIRHPVTGAVIVPADLSKSGDPTDPSDA